MDFKKYPSITNSYNQKYLDKIREYGFDKYAYCVTEKVHGANFAIYYDGDKFRIASRQRFLADDANFYGCQKILPETKEKIVKLCNNYIYYGTIKDIVIYGELCGGRYPHKEVKPVPDAKKVQGHIWYHPDNIFYAFDIKINGKFLPRFGYWCICAWLDIFNTQELYVGSLEECLAYTNEYQTTIPTRYNLPNIEDNLCEGNVIKPTVTLFFPNGERVILKNKNERFSEVSRKKEPSKTKVEIAEYLKPYLAAMLAHVTANRLHNVISKIGDVNVKDFGELMKQFSIDVMDDFLKNCEDFLLIDKVGQKYLRKAVNRKCATVIKDFFKERGEI